MKKIRNAVVCLVCLSLLVVFCAAKGEGVVSWGLKYNGEGKAPTAPANNLGEHDGLYYKENAQREVFFTFDLGFEAGYTAEVLDILKAQNIRAVFFLCGNYLKETELVERMISEGHAIGNHTDKHKDLPTLSDEKIRQDITDFADKFAEKYGAENAEKIRFFRPPQGRFSDKVLKAAKEENLRTVMWSIAIADWQKPAYDVQKNTAKISGRVHDGAIILLHIANPSTPKLLSNLLTDLAAKGYKIGDATQL